MKYCGHCGSKLSACEACPAFFCRECDPPGGEVGICPACVQEERRKWEHLKPQVRAHVEFCRDVGLLPAATEFEVRVEALRLK